MPKLKSLRIISLMRIFFNCFVFSVALLLNLYKLMDAVYTHTKYFSTYVEVGAEVSNPVWPFTVHYMPLATCLFLPATQGSRENQSEARKIRGKKNYRSLVITIISWVLTLSLLLYTVPSPQMYGASNVRRYLLGR